MDWSKPLLAGQLSWSSWCTHRSAEEVAYPGQAQWGSPAPHYLSHAPWKSQQARAGSSHVEGKCSREQIHPIAQEHFKFLLHHVC